MNAAIDQQRELYIKENKLETAIKAKINKKYKNKESSEYYGPLPEENDELGLFYWVLRGMRY